MVGVVLATQGMRSLLINPLRAKFFRGNINIYVHFMSLLHIDKTRVLKILPQVRPGPTYIVFYVIANIMGTDVLVTKGARASAAMILTELNRVNSVPAR